MKHSGWGSETRHGTSSRPQPAADLAASKVQPAINKNIIHSSVLVFNLSESTYSCLKLEEVSLSNVQL